MKKLLSLLSIILVSSSATSAVSNVKAVGEANTLGNGLNNKLAGDDNLTGQDKWDDMQLFYNKEQLNFDVDKDNNIINNHAKIQIKHNFVLGWITSIDTFDLMKSDQNDFSKFFNLKTISNDSGIPAYFTSELTMKENMLDELPAMNGDVTLDFKIKYKNTLIPFHHDFKITVHINKVKPAVIEKEQLNHYIGTNIIDLQTLDTSELESNNDVLVKEIKNKIDLMYPKIKDRWHFGSTPSLTERTNIVEMNQNELNVGGHVMLKYQLAKPKAAIPSGENRLGTIEGLDKYIVTKNGLYANYIKFHDVLDKWYKENLPDTYDRDFRFVEPVTGDAIIKPSSKTKLMAIKHPISSLKGKFQVNFNIAYAKLSDYISKDLGTIKGVNATSSNSDVEAAVQKAFEANPLYKDFKGMFQFVVSPTNGQFGQKNTVKLIVKNVGDEDKQYFKVGDNIDLSFNLDLVDINSIIENTIPNPGKFLDSKEDIAKNILNSLNQKYSELNGKIELDQASVDAINPADPSTWSVKVVVKDDVTSYTGSKTIKFDLNSIDAKDLISTNAFKLTDKFLLATKDSVSTNALKAFNESNSKLKGLISIDNSSLDSFDAKNKDTWTFKIKANDNVKDYINIDKNDAYSFDLSVLNIADDVFKSNSIDINDKLATLTTNPNDAANEIKNIVLGKNKAYADGINSKDLAHPELDGMIDVVSQPMVDGDAVNGIVKIVRNEGYDMKDYLTGEVKVGFKLTQVNIAEAISEKDIDNVINQIKLEDINDQYINETFDKLIKDKTIGLSKDDYKITYKLSDDTKPSLTVTIEIINDKAVYNGSISGTEKVLKIVDAGDIINENSVKDVKLSFGNLVNKTKEADNESAIADQIIQQLNGTEYAIDKNDFEISKINFDISNPKDTTYTLKAKESSKVIKGEVTMKLNIEASDIKDLLPMDKLNSYKLPNLFADPEEDIEKIIDDGSKELLTSSDIFTVELEKGTTKIEIKPYDSTIGAKYSDYIKGTVELSPNVGIINIVDLYNNVSDGTLDLGRQDGFNEGTDDSEIKSDIIELLKQGPYLKQKYMSSIAASLNGRFFDDINFKFDSDWTEEGDNAYRTITISAAEPFDKYITGEMKVKFETARVSKNLSEVLKKTDFTTELLDYATVIKNGDKYLNVKGDNSDPEAVAIYEKIKKETTDKINKLIGQKDALNIELNENNQAYVYTNGYLAFDITPKEGSHIDGDGTARVYLKKSSIQEIFPDFSNDSRFNQINGFVDGDVSATIENVKKELIGQDMINMDQDNPPLLNKYINETYGISVEFQFPALVEGIGLINFFEVEVAPANNGFEHGFRVTIRPKTKGELDIFQTPFIDGITVSWDINVY